VDLILEKGGINLLKEAMTKTKTDEDLMKFFADKLDINNSNLDKIIRLKVKEISNPNFKFKIDL
jgi:hypothetical protein